MAKYYGKIGFKVTTEERPGVWKPVVQEFYYFGDILSTYRRTSSTDKVNEDINVSNRISILADPFANNNLGAIAYIEWMGSLWKVSDVEVQFPRLILTVGGVYNGEQA